MSRLICLGRGGERVFKNPADTNSESSVFD